MKHYSLSLKHLILICSGLSFWLCLSAYSMYEAHRPYEMTPFPLASAWETVNHGKVKVWLPDFLERNTLAVHQSTMPGTFRASWSDPKGSLAVNMEQLGTRIDPKDMSSLLARVQDKFLRQEHVEVLDARIVKSHSLDKVYLRLRDETGTASSIVEFTLSTIDCQLFMLSCNYEETSKKENKSVAMQILSSWQAV